MVEEALEGLPTRFRKRIHNVAVLVENVPPGQLPAKELAKWKDSRFGRYREFGARYLRRCTNNQKSMFDLHAGPDRIVLYQKNIEAAAPAKMKSERKYARTVVHELGHYFGMTEAQLEDV